MIKRLHSIAYAYTTIVAKLENFYDFVIANDGKLRNEFIILSEECAAHKFQRACSNSVRISFGGDKKLFF